MLKKTCFFKKIQKKQQKTKDTKNYLLFVKKNTQGIRDTGYGIRDTGYGIRDTGYGIRDTGYGIRDTGYGIRVLKKKFFFKGIRVTKKVLKKKTRIFFF